MREKRSEFVGNWVIGQLGILSMSLLAILFLNACTSARTSSITQGEAENIAWETLQPYTSSQMRTNWAIRDTQIVKGDALPDAFQKERIDTCFQFSNEPPPPENIRPSVKYWLVEFAPLPATAQGTPLSPTDPPHIPEPFLRQALILIDATTGQVDAVRLSCVIY